MKGTKLVSTLLITLVMSMTACGEKWEPYSGNTTIANESMIADEPVDYTYEAVYDDNYFLKDAKEYDPSLSLLSFSSALASKGLQEGSTFFTSAKFEDVEGVGYEGAPTRDSVAYIVGHKRIDKSELFFLSVRSWDYGLEWCNNFLVGKTGDHEGFSLRANEIYNVFKEYISEHKNKRSVKLWLSGYSRGGAITNLLSSLILRDNKIGVEQKDMYVYTFEAPGCLETSNCIAYENVHNVLNSRDLVTAVPPASYGLGRCGVDYEIYDADVARLMHEFDNNINFPEFAPVDVGAEEPLANDKELLDYISDVVSNNQPAEGEEPYDWSMNNRDEYVDRYQSQISYFLGYAFAMSAETRNKIVEDVMAMGFSAVLLLSDGQTLADFLKTYLEMDNLEYEMETLVDACDVVIQAVTQIFLKVLAIYLIESSRPSLYRLIYFHMPETVHTLLVNAHSKVPNA